MKINIDLVKTGTVVTDVASVFVLVATSNINVDDLNVSRGRWNALSPRVSINVNIRKNHSTNKCGPAGMGAPEGESPDALGVVIFICEGSSKELGLEMRIKAKISFNNGSRLGRSLFLPPVI